MQMAKTFGEILFFRVLFDPQLGQMMSEECCVSVAAFWFSVAGVWLLNSSWACSNCCRQYLVILEKI